MLSPCEHKLPLREDVVTEPNMRNEILANDPDTTGVSRGYFAVPKVTIVAVIILTIISIPGICIGILAKK